MVRRSPTLLLATLACAASQARAAPHDGLLDGAQWSLLGRNYFLQNDYRTQPSPIGQSLRQEWAQGFIADFRSGFTPGALGLGFDAHAFLGLKLDGGRGHAGTGLLPRNADGSAADDYSDAGGALKLDFSRSTLKLGEMTVETPVFDTGDKRLQPEYASGALLDSRELAGVHLQAGRFTAFRNQDSASGHGDFDGYGASTHGSAVSFAGADFAPPGDFGGALFAGQLDDAWRQYYLNLHYGHAGLLVDGNLYRTRDEGQARAGAIDTTTWSLSARQRFGAQALTLGYQQVDGDTPFDFVGGDSIYLANSIKYADFNGPGEKSWQLRYDLDLGVFGIPGLGFMARYVRGSGIDGSHAPADGAYAGMYGRGGRHWERDSELRYVFQSGPAKDLSLYLSQVSHRADAAQGGDDIDRLYLIIEYPLKGAL